MNICRRLVLYYYVTSRRSLLSGCLVLLWEVAAYVCDIDILPGGDIILYKVDLILFVMYII